MTAPASAQDAAHPIPEYDAIAKSVVGNEYRIAQALRAAYNAGMRYKDEVELDRRVTAHGAAERARAVEAHCKAMCTLCEAAYPLKLNGRGSWVHHADGDWSSPCQAAAIRALASAGPVRDGE